MNAKSLFGLIAATATTIGSEVGVPSIPGVQILNRYGDVNPLYDQMPLLNRLDYRCEFKNSTGQSLTFQSGELFFLNEQGAVLGTAPIDTKTFGERARIGGGSFEDGRLLVSMGDHNKESYKAVHVGVDGRVWVAGAGERRDNQQKQGLIARFLNDGRLDPAFDENGLRAVDGFEVVNALHVDSAQRLFITGMSTNKEMFIAKLNESGSLSASFAIGGVRPITVGAISSASAVTTDDEGRVLVAGSAVINERSTLVVARLSANGTLDSSFGASGIQTVVIPGAASDRATGIAVDGADRIVVGGVARFGGDSGMLALRLLDDGSLDGKFAEGAGFITVTFSGMVSCIAEGMSMTSGGRILLAGAAFSEGGDSSMALVRLTADGELDTLFSDDGKLLTDFPGYHRNRAQMAVPDLFGRVMLFGQAMSDTASAMGIVRVKSDGTLDDTFSGDGKRVITGFPSGIHSSASGGGLLYVGEVGDIIVAGNAEVLPDDPDEDDGTRLALARLNLDGDLNPGVLVPQGLTVVLDFLDFPFTENDSSPPFAGFDPKLTPAKINVNLKFKEYAMPLIISGVQPAVFEQNARNLIFPLKSWQGAEPYTLALSQGHHFGQNHVGNDSQRYAFDVVMHDTQRNTSRLPGNQVNVNNLLPLYINRPEYDPNRTYVANDFNESSIIYGQWVYAVAAGQVVFATNNQPENWPVGTRAANTVGGGNSVVIDHGNGEFSFYAHMITGTVQVNVGDSVVQGQQLGRVGNSGSSSGPHLHFHVMRTFGPDAKHGYAVPTYFTDVEFPTSSGGPVVRQLRSDMPTGLQFRVANNPFTFAPGAVFGPGKPANVPVSAALNNAPTLRPPVQVTGQIDSTDASAAEVADGGDLIEKVYRVQIPEAGHLGARLIFDDQRDLDVLVYNSVFRAVKPLKGKTTTEPEKGSFLLPAGTHYVFVTEFDKSRGRTAVNYTLELSFVPLPKLKLAPTPQGPKVKFPIALDVEGRPVPLPPTLRVEVNTRLEDSRGWEPLDIQAEEEDGEWALLLPAIQRVREAAYFRIYHDDPDRELIPQ